MLNYYSKNNEHNYKLDKIDNDSEHNTNYNNKLFTHLEQNNTILDKTNTVLTKTKNHLSFEDSSLDKTLTINKKKKLPLLYDNNNGSNEIIGSKDNKMMISTELGMDGVQRGIITLLPNGDIKKSLFSLKTKKT